MSNDIQDTQHVLNAVKKLTGADLEKLASDGKTVLAVGYFPVDTKLPQLKNGWNLRLLPAGADETHKQLIFQPSSARAKDIWRKGQIKLAMEAGLNQVQAEVWAASRMARRHELIQALGKAIQDPAKITAYQNYNRDTDYHEWSRTWGIKDGLSPSNRRFLVDQLKMVLDGEIKAKSEIATRMRELQEQEKRRTTLTPELEALLNAKKPETATPNENKEPDVTPEEQPEQIAEVPAVDMETTAVVEESAVSTTPEAQEVPAVADEVEPVEPVETTPTVDTSNVSAAYQD